MVDNYRTDELVVVWTSADREVALKMVFMYTLNSRLKGWWDNVTLIIWGPSAKLLPEDAELREQISKMKDAGVKLIACKACADMYGVSSDLEKLGVEVIYVGTMFTNYLKENYKVITI
ncbi:hypothetical protein SAMN05660649_03185 [Desulfotomaculum arcticum]|uniref:DsrE/DsrF-like family protein n=1 Tax=Desulfotruncus arcticus DSM 17038 TaxID=1121424 RepID=A0A1I2VVP9_9FIRM|nr:DsrE family protein [Desulfotruncus arcticus]SFG93092.1 hypothetical protein SAMN05660649_03185 [Desulfotomaculum arcticum] [Desulfotruncus arcticus DSM 17038]